MASYTSFLNLEKPTTSERLDVLKINSNWDKIDAGVSALNSQIGNKSTLAYVDINITNDVATQVNSASGGLINWNNFIGGYVINSNSIVAVFYTYSNLIYVRLKDVANMQDMSVGNYTVRCWYKVS